MYPTIHLFGFSMASYMVTVVLAAVVGWILAFILIRRSGVGPVKIGLILLACTIGAFIGARAFSVLSNPAYIRNPFSGGIPVRYLLRYGGLSLYGALIGGTVFSAMPAAALRVSVLVLLDRMAPVGQLAFTIGRIGCLLSGCCWGAPTLFPIALVFERFDAKARPIGVPLHAIQLYEMMATLLSATILFLVLRSGKTRRGSVFALSIILYPSARFFLDDLRGAERIFIDGLSSMQWVSLILISSGLLILILLHPWPTKKDAAAIVVVFLFSSMFSCNPYNSMPNAWCRGTGDCVRGEYCIKGRCKLTGKIDVEIGTKPQFQRTTDEDLILNLSKCRIDTNYPECSGKIINYLQSRPTYPCRLELEKLPRGKFLLVAGIDLDRDGKISNGDMAGYGFVTSSNNSEGAGSPQNTVLIRDPFHSIATMVDAIRMDRSMMTLQEFLAFWFLRK